MSTKSPELFLSPDQRALLLAALNSNAPVNSQPRSSAMSKSQSSDHLDDSTSSFDVSYFADADALGDVDYSLDLNYNFGLENPEPKSNGNDHEKRKLSIDNEEDEEADPHETEPKRREGDDKTAKKPGRKPITNEPTSKRKAQNRAAQRAFRERKEKHLKDLEQKVQDLEKVSESTSKENKALKDQVEKLQTELKEYRKRFSLGGGVVNRSPSNSISNHLNALEGSLGTTGGFNFDFPLFGSFAQPGQNVVGGPKSGVNDSPNRGSNFPPTNYRVSPIGILEINQSNRNSMGSVSPHGSNSDSPATRSNSNGLINGSTQQSPLQVHRVSIDEPKFPSNDILSDLFSPSVLNAVNNEPIDYLNMNKTSVSSQQSTPHMGSFFSFSDSPTASSVSQQSMKAGPNNSSSCGTTPEATDMASPSSQNKNEASKLNSISEEGEQKVQTSRQHRESSFGDVSSFCDMLGKACGTSSNPIPPAGRNLPAQENTTGVDNSFSWLAAQNGGTFEPALFNDYRDSGELLTNTAGMSYFDDAFPSAFDLNLPPTPPASSVEKTKIVAPGLQEDEDEDEEVVPGEDPNSLLKCNQIWDKVQSHPKFASGEIDMDNLCTELRAKAKCSESGVVMNKKDVDAILNKPVPSLWGL